MCTTGHDSAVFVSSAAMAGMEDAMRVIAVVNAVITERFFMQVTLAPPLDTHLRFSL